MFTKFKVPEESFKDAVIVHPNVGCNMEKQIVNRERLRGGIRRLMEMWETSLREHEQPGFAFGQCLICEEKSGGIHKCGLCLHVAREHCQQGSFPCSYCF